MKKERSVYLLSFLIPIGIMMVLFVIKGIYPFGDRCFLSGDLYHQYMPFFSELLHKVQGGESLSFSFNVGIGSNFLALFVYYLASPFHWLAFLLPERFLIEFIGYLIVFKTGLCGLTAGIYFCRHFRTDNPAVILFSLFYAFNGFMMAYNYNIMWVDCVWLLPLIVLGLEQLVKEGKYALYCISLSMSILTNYYLSIMICIFLVLYFAVLFVNEKKHRLRSIGLFACFSLLAGLMASALLVPEVCAILQTDFGDMDFPEKIETYFSVLDVLARHCVCVSSERGLDHWPNIFCGSAVLMLVPMYVMNAKISVREKFTRLALIGLLLLSFSVNILDFIWHGLNYPDSLPARQSYIYCFLVLTICYHAFHQVKEADKQQIVTSFLIGISFVLFVQKFVDHDDFQLGVKLATIGFLAVYGILLYLYRTRERKFVLGALFAVALVVAVVECGVDAINTSLGTVSRSAYLGQQEDYRSLYEMTGEWENELYRVEKFTRKTKNDGTLTGYPTASVFSSTLNSYVMDLYTRWGMRHSKVYYGYDGATALTQSLLNVKYMFGESDAYENALFTKVAQSGDIRLYECNVSLPFGYVAPVGYDLPESTKKAGITLQNEMVQDLGIEGELFVKKTSYNSTESASFSPTKSGIYYAQLTSSGTKKIKYTGGATEDETFGDLKTNSILYLGYLEPDNSIVLTNGDDKDTTPKFSVAIYRMDEEVLQQVIEALSAQHFETASVESDLIAGTISLETPGRVIFSVPYEDGWDVKINGESVTGEKFGGVLMAFDLEPGEYQIEMKNRPQGAIPGAWMSAGGILIFVCVVLFHRRKAVRKETAARRKQKRQLSPALPSEEEVIGEKPEEEIPDLDELDLVIEGEGGEEKDEV
ncbi:MAG: YfhO family protein [Acetatifactor sp.]